MKKHTLIIVDDHKMFRDGLKFVISQFEDIELIAEASNGIEFLNILNSHKIPELVLMDISMPEMDGITATKEALKKYPDLKIIALSMFGDEEYYYKMIHAGVKGFVLKESGSSELRNAIDSILTDDNFFSQELLRNIILNINSEKKQQNKNSPKAEITERELEVLELICQGLNTPDIAERLNISQRTVEGHRSHLLTKTKAKNIVNLIMYAIKHKIIDL